MKQVSLLLGALLMVAAAASAQGGPPTPKVEVGLDYSLFHANSSPRYAPANKQRRLGLFRIQTSIVYSAW